MARYLLTGAAGFIGARVARHLLDLGSTVVGIDNMNDSYDPRLKEWRMETLRDDDRFIFKRTNIANRDELESVFNDEPFDGVINLAARAGVRQSVSDPWVYYETNVLGALNLLDACRARSIPKFVQASTSSLYGLRNPRPYKEDADTSRPLSPYAASKGAAEMLCHSYHYLHQMDITIVRYFTVYGPAGRPDMSIFRFIQWIAEGRPLVLYGDGLQERDFTFVEDIARGTVAALRPLGFEVINLGGDRPVKMMDVIAMIEKRLGKSANIDQRQTAPADMPSTWADIHKAQKFLDWRPEVSLESGLDAAISWYQQERDWAESIPTTD
ncbi:MAG: GDP-mannose 4,6-dehydratase [Anaerolineales bacterium]|nr:GDP-mannose 4,6-dehydratase [Anaerolineales bacterium]